MWKSWRSRTFLGLLVQYRFEAFPYLETYMAELPSESQERRSKEESDRRKQDSANRRCGLDRRRGPGRRRSDTRRSAEEGEMTSDQFELVQAINEYKRVNNRPFPTWTEVLDVLIALGYRKVAEPQDIGSIETYTED